MNLIDKILTRGIEEIIKRDHLEKRLKSGKKLRVKLGIDPTAPDLHLGHTVVLRKLRQFQDAGHKAVFIVGDFTATIGDPSGRNELRPRLTMTQVKRNMKNYLKEADRVINIKKAEVRYNSEWYGKKGAMFLFELTSKFTVAPALERDDFKKRLQDERDVSLLEILYPLFQGYDSVAVKADVELGGTDQKFNLLMGRKVQKRYGLPEQDILTVPLVEGTDGVRKMSKSLGNYIGLSDSPKEMFGKTMSIPDDLMAKYFTLLTDVPEKEIERLKADRSRPSLASRPPIEWKKRLAFEIVKIYHGAQKAAVAQTAFERVFVKKETPEKMPVLKLKPGAYSVVDLLVRSKTAPSKSEARRLVSQGAVEMNGETIIDWTKPISIRGAAVFKIGKRRFFKVIAK